MSCHVRSVRHLDVRERARRARARPAEREGLEAEVRGGYCLVVKRPDPYVTHTAVPRRRASRPKCERAAWVLKKERARSATRPERTK